MTAVFCRLACVVLIALSTGCAMCANCDDETYPADGGRWQRVDPFYGRVGSIFTPEVWTTVDGYYHESEPESIPRGEPTPAEDNPPQLPDGAPPAEPLPPEASIHQPPGWMLR
jgi:hypothetical protein